MFGACQRHSVQLPRAALRLFSSLWEFSGNALLAAPAGENLASVECVGYDQASTSGISCGNEEDVHFVRIDRRPPFSDVYLRLEQD